MTNNEETINKEGGMSMQDAIIYVRSCHAEVPGMNVRRLINDVKEFWNFDLEDFAHKKNFGPYPNFDAVVNFLRSIEGATLVPIQRERGNFFIHFKRPESQGKIVSMIHASNRNRRRNPRVYKFFQVYNENNHSVNSNKHHFNIDLNKCQSDDGSNKHESCDNSNSSSNGSCDDSINSSNESYGESPFVKWMKSRNSQSSSENSNNNKPVNTPSGRCPVYMMESAYDEVLERLIETGVPVDSSSNGKNKKPKNNKGVGCGFMGVPNRNFTKKQNTSNFVSLELKKNVKIEVKKYKKVDILSSLENKKMNNKLSVIIEEEEKSIVDGNVESPEGSLCDGDKDILPTAKEVEDSLSQSVQDLETQKDNFNEVPEENTSEKVKINELEAEKQPINNENVPTDSINEDNSDITFDDELTKRINELSNRRKRNYQFPIMMRFSFSRSPLRLIKATAI